MYKKMIPLPPWTADGTPYEVKLKWRKDKPIKGGWYWAIPRRKLYHIVGTKMDMVYVSMVKGKKEEMTVFIAGYPQTFNVEDFAEWYGPFLAPKK